MPAKLASSNNNQFIVDPSKVKAGVNWLLRKVNFSELNITQKNEVDLKLVAANDNRKKNRVQVIEENYKKQLQSRSLGQRRGRTL